MPRFGVGGTPNNAWIVTASTYTITGDTHNGTAVIDGLVSTTAALRVGMPVTGTGVGAGAIVVSVDSVSQVTVDVVSTATGTVAITFESEFVVPLGVETVWITLAGGGEGGFLATPKGSAGGSSSFGSYLTALGGSETVAGENAGNGGGAGVSTGGGPGVDGKGGQLFEKIAITVTPAESIDITIGAGGAGGTNGGTGGAGICIVEWVA